MIKLYISERSYYGVKHEVDYSYYRRFNKLNSIYFQDEGEGTTMATQLITAINKLVYEYYNNGLVYDNTSKDWKDCDCREDDLCSFANWIHKYYPGLRPILDKVKTITKNSEYEKILKELVSSVMNETFLRNENNKPKTSASVYDIDEPFKVKDK